MVGNEDAAVSAGRLLADSISLLGHKVYAGSPKASKPFGCSVFRAGCVRATDSTSNRGQERTPLWRRTTQGQTAPWPATSERDFPVKNFKSHSGETLPELRSHYTTLGKPARDAQDRVTNAVLILHGTGGTGHQFLTPIFAGELFGPGQLLDATRYFIILPDGIGHGKSSKPSDGLHAHFPQYDYDDMVAAHHQLLREGLGVNHLRLIL